MSLALEEIRRIRFVARCTEEATPGMIRVAVCLLHVMVDADVDHHGQREHGNQGERMLRGAIRREQRHAKDCKPQYEQGRGDIVRKPSRPIVGGLQPIVGRPRLVTRGRQAQAALRALISIASNR
jgi:hypothetical protein